MKIADKLISPEVRALVKKLYSDDAFRQNALGVRIGIAPMQGLEYLLKSGAFSLVDHIYLRYHTRKLSILETKIAILGMVTKAGDEVAELGSHNFATPGGMWIGNTYKPPQQSQTVIQQYTATNTTNTPGSP